MASIAARIRPPFIAALVLTTFAVLPWHPQAQPPAGAVLPRTIAFAMPAAPALPANGSVIAPPSPFRDARPYPEGMVIAPPDIDRAIVLDIESPLIQFLSGLFAPFTGLSG